MSKYNWAMDKKGIELFRKDTPKQVSITIGTTRVNTQGKPVQVRFEKQMARVFLVVDCSGSMAGDKLGQAKRGIIDFARDAFIKEYQVGLISFDTTAKLVCEPTYDISVLSRGLEQVQPMGSTNMSEAIILAYNQLKKYDSTRVIVIATDGKPDNELDAITAGNIAKKDKMDIITIGTDDADQEFLKKLASKTQLAKKVAKEQFSEAISSSAMMLPAPKNIVKR
jgi:Mg-chelatase subunit ChlD